MSRERWEQQLEHLLAPLRDPPLKLDEVAQARIQARLEAAIDHAADAAANDVIVGQRRHAVVTWATVAAVVALVVAVLAHSGGAPRVAATRTGATPAMPSVAPEPAVADSLPIPTLALTVPPKAAAVDSLAGAAAAPALIRVPAGESAEVTIEHAVVTIYGPGWLSPARDGAIVDAAGITVNRSRGAAAVAIHYHDTKILVTHAVFAASHTTETRVNVMRGEVELLCVSGARTLTAGESATCGPMAPIQITTHPSATRASKRSPRPEAPALPPEPAPEQAPAVVESDAYAAAESAMRRGDLEAASASLLAVVAATPESLAAATALLDLARLAIRRGDPGQALGYLDRLDRHPQRDALAAATAHLRAALTPAADTRTSPR